MKAQDVFRIRDHSAHMVWKRTIGALLAAGLAAGVAGCGSSQSQNETGASPSSQQPSAATPSQAKTGRSGGSGQQAAGIVPQPSHVVIVIEENHSFDSIIGSSAAPYLNSLAAQGALFTDSSAITHPSEPNYIALFSGSTQGLADDSCPHTYSAPNLGSQLIAAGRTFAGYSDGLPSAGYLGCSAGNYVRRHAPWTNFPSVPASASQPFSAFPSDYSLLPTVSIVIPNVAHDMHDGPIGAADSWLRDNLDGYVQWATSHNSLLVVTWDEDDDHSGNHIATIVTGASVKPGRYSEAVNHYRLLRTIESAYGLPPLGSAADTTPITDIWSSGS